MSARTVADVISRLDMAMWMPRIKSWEIAQTDRVWGAHAEVAADDSVDAVMALTKLASEVGSEVAESTGRLVTVTFAYQGVPVRVWWLKPTLPAVDAPTEPDGEDEPEMDSPPRRAAREIQALHDPVVVGYVVCVGALRITLRPMEWAQWQAWQHRLGVEPGSTTYRGETATAHGRWGDVPVIACCYLDRLPRSAPVEIGGAS